MHHFYIALLILFLTLPVHAQIQEPKAKGMNVLTVQPKPSEKTPTLATTEEQNKDILPNEKNEKPEDIALTPQDALLPLKELQKWPHLNDLNSGSKDRVNAALEALEQDLGAVPPAALFTAAQAYVERGERENAALTYYLAQLRARFDFKRWPVLGDGVTRPQNDMTGLSLLVGQKISPWVLSDIERMNKIFDKVEKTDLTTPYKYLPTYKLPTKMKAEELWPELLEDVRSEYFTKTNELRKALTQIKR